MIRNPVKELWSEGKPVLNGWLSIGDPFSAEIMASQGWDSLTIDLQHGALDYTALLPMLQTLQACGVGLSARVPWLDPAMIMKALDAGAMTIICPMINTPEQASEFVSYIRYPPDGQRSYGPTRAVFAQGSDIEFEANAQIVGLAMIETKLAMENLDAIAATPGLDGLYIGPTDLSIGISDGQLPAGMDREEPEVVDAIHRILEACKANGKRAALHCTSPAYAAKAIGWGFDMCTVSNDVRLLASSAGAAVNQFRKLLKDGS